MKIRRRLTGVLCSFLEAFTSRYSDYQGYWVFGLLVREGHHSSFDLLRTGSGSSPSPVRAATAHIARSRFAEILEKSGIPTEYVCEANITINRLEPPTFGPVNGRVCSGYRYLFHAEITSDLGKRYTAEKIVFVAPHDASVELRSIRVTG